MMKSVYALIPAALLVGTVLPCPVEAKGTANFSAHATRLISRQDYFTVMNAKKLGKIRKVGSLKARKAHKKAASAGKAAKDVRKTASVKPHKKPAKVPVAGKTQKTVSVAASKQAEIKPRKIAQEEPASMSKVLRSGPREVKNIMSGEAESQRALIAARMTTMKHGDQKWFVPQVESSTLEKLAQPPTVNEMTENLQIGGGSELPVVEIIREMAPSYGVPIWFALRIADVESNYNPYARGLAGEIGVYQLKCQTARGIGFEGDCSALTDVRTNVHWGLKHLSLAIASSGGNLRLAASKHNAGLSRKSVVDSYVAKVF